MVILFHVKNGQDQRVATISLLYLTVTVGQTDWPYHSKGMTDRKYVITPGREYLWEFSII